MVGVFKSHPCQYIGHPDQKKKKKKKIQNKNTKGEG
jgi:hypothetical protein